MYKLMIVDDEPQILEGMKRILDWKQYGFGRIETCESTEEAMSKVVDLRRMSPYSMFALARSLDTKRSAG